MLCFLMTGRYLTMLPVEPKLGKMLVLGAVLNCLDPILTVVSGLSVRDPFLTPMDKKDVSEISSLSYLNLDGYPIYLFNVVLKFLIYGWITEVLIVV